MYTKVFGKRLGKKSSLQSPERMKYSHPCWISRCHLGPDLLYDRAAWCDEEGEQVHREVDAGKQEEGEDYNVLGFASVDGKGREGVRKALKQRDRVDEGGEEGDGDRVDKL